MGYVESASKLIGVLGVFSVTLSWLRQGPYSLIISCLLCIHRCFIAEPMRERLLLEALSEARSGMISVVASSPAPSAHNLWISDATHEYYPRGQTNKVWSLKSMPGWRPGVTFIVIWVSTSCQYSDPCGDHQSL